MKQLSRLIALALALCAGPALAQDASRHGVYLIGGIGQGMADFNSSDFPTDPDFDRQLDDRATTWNIGVGYRFHRNIAVELGYASLGEYNARYTGTGAFAGETTNDEYDVTAWKLAAVGILPVMQQLSLIGKLGVALTRVENRFSESIGGVTASESASKSKSTLLWGLGAQYDVTKNLGLRAEYESFGTVGSEITDDSGTGRAKIASFNLNVVYSFQ
jgi:OmpA-OmpF porin, OOP family